MELISLNATHRTRRMSFQKIASVLLHVVVLVLITYEFRPAFKVKRVSAARVLTAYAPHQSAAPPKPKRPKMIKPKEEPKLAMKQEEPSPPSVAGDTTGDKDVSVALATVYPAPNPDLSALPHGTKGDVIVSLTIDETGKVVDVHVDQGLGHGVDEAVLAVVETWVFDPATKADKPIASVQQLLFHFERA
jgi:periplasmic protein TonB